MPAVPVRLGPAAPHSRGRDALIVFARSEKDLPDFEQRNVAQGPARVALGGGDEARNETRAHVGKVGCDRVGERERRRAAAEQFGRRLRDERPGDRLAQRKRGQRALGEPRALLHERQHRFGHAVVEPRQGRGRRAVDAGDAQNLLDDVGLDLDVRPPRRDNDRSIADAEAEAGQDRLALVARDVDAKQPLDFAIGERNRTPRRRRIARHHHPRRLAAADRKDELGREITGRARRIRDRRRARTDSARRS